MPQLSTTKWKELRDGRGLEEVPKQWRKIMGCCMCGTDSFHSKLYTDRAGRTRTASTTKELQKAIDEMSPNCYCRYHAESMFGPREGE